MWFSSDRGIAPHSSSYPGPVEHLDLATVIKVSEAISGEIVLEKLITRFMQTALEQAGAERALLMLPRGDEQRIEAEARTDRDKVTVDFRRSSVTPSELPESLLRYVIRTQESVTLRDVSTDNLFSEDEYMHRKHPRSVFCLPLIKRRKLMGVLYLENSLAPGVFTPSRLAILELIASQAAISLEQARQYAELMRANEDLRAEISKRKRAEELEAEITRERAVFLQEKTRLAGEIHDSLAQSFTGITMQLEMAKEVMTNKDNEVLGYVERANDLARFGLAEARRSILTLQPMIIKDADLIESLQRLVERSNIPGRLCCTFHSNLENEQFLPVVVRQDLLRIAQEAISNALRHAKSTFVTVSLRSDPPNLILKVKHNGRGILTEAETREGFGFVKLRARVKKLSGSLDIRTAPGSGTSIVVSVPLR
jgi:signal transduction histidine kinase